MNFKDTQQRSEYFDTIIDNYIKDTELSEKMITALQQKEERNLLYYLFKHKDSINPGVYSFVLDVIY